MFEISFNKDLSLYLVKVNSVRVESALAADVLMLMGDCLLPLQYFGESSGHFASSLNTIISQMSGHDSDKVFA